MRIPAKGNGVMRERKRKPNAVILSASRHRRNQQAYMGKVKLAVQTDGCRYSKVQVSLNGASI